jgi:hypothetical protein
LAEPNTATMVAGSQCSFWVMCRAPACTCPQEAAARKRRLSEQNAGIGPGQSPAWRQHTGCLPACLSVRPLPVARPPPIPPDPPAYLNHTPSRPSDPSSRPPTCGEDGESSGAHILLCVLKCPRDGVVVPYKGESDLACGFKRALQAQGNVSQRALDALAPLRRAGREGSAMQCHIPSLTPLFNINLTSL